MKRLALFALLGLSLAACAPSISGESVYQPSVVERGQSLTVGAEKTTYVQTTTPAGLAGFSDADREGLIPQFAYEDVIEGATRTAPVSRDRFELISDEDLPDWGVKLESVNLVRKLTGVRTSGNQKQWREQDTLQVTVSLRPPKAAVGKSEMLLLTLKTRDGRGKSDGFGLMGFLVNVKAQ